ncbi:hypothetical protein AQUCO_00700703v1 [Aquilegia coerulea]|uniref:Uncharacterized protein n=1 Tax=Aquilegia coerulea TaxID=218851 RepID=A0A2G5ELB3_AQUCA|nr:hypothetical protein AQUCO_00700703v1 [Aquilegia coerulea]
MILGLNMYWLDTFQTRPTFPLNLSIHYSSLENRDRVMLFWTSTLMEQIRFHLDLSRLSIQLPGHTRTFSEMPTLSPNRNDCCCFHIQLFKVHLLFANSNLSNFPNFCQFLQVTLLYIG